MRIIGLRFTVLLCALAATACTSTINSQGASTNVRMPFSPPPAPPRPAAPPDVGMAAPLLPPAGLYVGVGHLRGYRGLGCQSQIQVTGFQVDGDRVRYLRFRGPIRPDLSVRLQAGNNYIQGHFEGQRFVGVFYRPPPSCSYNVQLAPAG